MAARFFVLASGSAGNCAFLRVDGFGLLIDIGLGPRLIASRLAAIGATWKSVNAVLLTHTHTDHWKDLTLNTLRQEKIPLYCHPQHHTVLARYGGYFDPLFAAGLVRPFIAGEALALPGGVTGRPIRVPHDSDPTFAFRLDGPPGLFGHPWSVGYAADLGAAWPDLLDAFAGVNVLALEFNHDEAMERESGRPKHLIDRVFSDLGHLSNQQAADAVRGIVDRSAQGALRHLIQLHLSRDCNRPNLAREAGRAILADMGSGAAVTTAQQDSVTNGIDLDGECLRRKPVALGTPH